MLRRIYGDGFTLLIAGRLGPKTYREYVENMVRGLKLEENVKMLGYVENKLLPLLYNATDVVIVPSYSEGSPLVIPEALACETPVVATSVGGNTEYLAMVHLSDLLIELNKYDFSEELYTKLALTLEKKYDINVFIIPSWNDVVQRLLNQIKLILR
jgi:hypothetical protein